MLVTANDGHNWIEANGLVLVVTFPTFKPKSIKLPVNMASVINLPVIDTRNLLRNERIEFRLAGSVTVIESSVKIDQEKISSVLELKIEPSPAMVGQSSALVLSGEGVKEVKTGVEVEFFSALLFDTDQINFTKVNEQLIITGIGFTTLDAEMTYGIFD